MNRLKFLLALMFLATSAATPAVTLEECLALAEANYPLIKKYALVEQTADLSLSDINRGWLPRIGVYSQATVQNTVPSFPATLRDVVAQMGQEMKGLGHIQYKAGAEISQTIWDGGAAKAQRRIERASADESRASLSVGMYAVRDKVIGLYFGILLIEEQIRQTENTVGLLEANRRLLESMLKNGVAMQADVDMVEAEELTMRQNITDARSAAGTYRELLSVYTGRDLAEETLVTPVEEMPSSLEPARPELAMYEAQQRLLDERRAAIESSVMPRAGFFAQLYYGYPGLNYFESMVNRNMSFNLLAGVKLTWNIDSFYTKKNSERRLDVAAESIAADRELFLFNNRLQRDSQTGAIGGLRKVIADDARIVELRDNVRKSAESQLRNGIIDATALLAKITDENNARLTARYHEIQLLQQIQQLRNTLNR